MCDSEPVGPHSPARWNLAPAFTLRFPAWVPAYLQGLDGAYPTAADRMAVAIALARLNVEHGTGGPFGAAVFDLAHHTLLAPGVTAGWATLKRTKSGKLEISSGATNGAATR